MIGKITRRRFTTGLAAGASLALSGCNSSYLTSPAVGNSGIDYTSTGSIGTSAIRPAIGVDANLTSADQMYGEITDGGYTLAAIPYEEMEQNVRRQRTPNTVGIQPGSIMIDTRAHYAYLGLTNDEVVRYGVGVGKAGFEWAGHAKVGRKAPWPVWTPPAEMIDRKPELEKYRGGMPPGPENPLGARSMYLFADGRDTLYRLHGTPEWQSIGKSMSSGCIRFLNHDIIDLYERVSIGTPVVVV
jgi:lipoprotein-anchoring transpeptidase ErfK/SrfK